ncbi:hypothetical protein HNR29_004912 [Rhizobium leguminosarum]|nr:hypothetical protein [Rhizobium leguminosarum]
MITDVLSSVSTHTRSSWLDILWSVGFLDDHLPLYRLNEIFARMGADIPDSTLVDCAGAPCSASAPERADRSCDHGQ